MSPAATFERVYRALKDQLGSARFPAGYHLEPAALSQALNASVTPARDALHRLAGEGLVETQLGEGFRTPQVTEVALRHLYQWNAALLELATRARGEARAQLPDEPGSSEPNLIEAVEQTFLAIAARSGNPEHVAAIERLNDRLRPVRHVELELIGGPEAELSRLSRALTEEPPAALRRALRDYHRARLTEVGHIVAALVAPR